MGQAEGQIAVIGQKQESSRIVVEPADGKDALFLAEAREIRRQIGTVLRVVQRRDNAGRFVKRVVKRRHGRLDAFAINFDAVFGGICLSAEFANDAAVDRDTPFDNPPLRLTAGSQTGASDNFLQPFHERGTISSLQAGRPRSSRREFPAARFLPFL